MNGSVGSHHPSINLAKLTTNPISYQCDIQLIGLPLYFVVKYLITSSVSRILRVKGLLHVTLKGYSVQMERQAKLRVKTTPF